VHTPIYDIWDTALTGLLFALIIWATIAIWESRSISSWIGYGALCACAALVNASTLSVCVLFLFWLSWRKSKISLPAFPFAMAALATCILLLMPWTVRNYRVFRSWIPLRSSLGLELWLGNNPDGNAVNSFLHHPFLNPSEAAEFKSLGEVDYMQIKQREAIIFMRSHPWTTLRFIARRIVLYWFAVTDRPSVDWSSLPLYLKTLLLPNLLLILFSWYGGVMAIRTRNPAAWPFAIALLVFPLPYYFTHALVRYRFPLDPLLAVLSVYGVPTAMGWMKVCDFKSSAHRHPALSRLPSAKGSDK